jgi:hypothetical protein
MFKKALILMGLAASAACGGEPPAQQVGVATSALQVSMGPFFSDNVVLPAHSVTSFLEQVPIGTQTTDHVGDGTYPKYYFSSQTLLGTFANSTVPGRQIIDWSFTLGEVGPIIANSNNLHCATYTTGAFAGSDFSGYLPASFTPAHLKNGYFFNQTSSKTGSMCGVYGFPQFAQRAPKFIIMDFNPDGSPNANNFPSSWANPWQSGGLHDMRVRIDLDFPEFGVTNRYFYTLTIQGG